MSVPPILIDSLAELEGVLGRRGPLLFGRERIRLELPELDQDERRAWESRLNTNLLDCGCAWGAAGALVAGGLTLFPMLSKATSFSFAEALLASIAVLTMALLGGLLGKLIGLWRARTRLRRTCDELRSWCRPAAAS